MVTKINPILGCDPALPKWDDHKILQMGVSKIGVIPKWMVKIMENRIKMDDLGVPLFSETPK